ncbi:hypothetical protein [Hyphococcus sp.]|jgi:hypothetical protein|uniref:hypothetical protein n=1 Tax=Hyphococcus sp. TaxID=2038636 RepID=UPI003D106714
MSLVEIMSFEYGDAGSVSFVESALQAEDIFYHVSDNRYVPIGRPKLFVARDDAARARDLLIELGFENLVYSKSRLGLQ